jgi:hypothetical protein
MSSPVNPAGASRPARTVAGAYPLSPAARLCAFALLAILLFFCAREVGRSLGPIGTSHVRSVVTPGGRSGGGMGDMGAGPASVGRQPGSAG